MVPLLMERIERISSKMASRRSSSLCIGCMIIFYCSFTSTISRAKNNTMYKTHFYDAGPCSRPEKDEPSGRARSLSGTARRTPSTLLSGSRMSFLTLVRPAKAGMFSGRQPHRGNS